MSRPPRPLFKTTTAGGGVAFTSMRQFLPVEFAQMVELEKELAENEARLGVTGADGDFAYTLMELSALVAHTLGLHNNLYARDAWLGTAETSRALVLHARRLAYEPDRGLAASGYAVLTIGEGLTGTLPAGFALASSPRGEVKAQTYETLVDLAVDAARNAAMPVARERAASLVFSSGRASLLLPGTSLQIDAGTVGVLVRDANSTRVAVRVLSAEIEKENTRVEVELLDLTLGLANSTQPADWRFLGMPAEKLQRFGWDADTIQFPPSQVEDARVYPGASGGTSTTPKFGYTVTREGGSGERLEDVYLSRAIDANLLDSLVVVKDSGKWKVAEVTEQGSAGVAFRRGFELTFDVGYIDSKGVPRTRSQSQTVEFDVNATVSYLRLLAGSTLDRPDIAIQTPMWGAWRVEASLIATEPNPGLLPAPVELDADFGDFRPGGLVAFETLDGAESQVFEVQSLTVSAAGTTTIGYVALTDDPTTPWTLDNTRVYGNVARVTHGEAVEEILGGSDGVTPFLAFQLKKAPVTQVPGADGGETAIEVRVNEVAWTLVDDFFDSGPEDRHYRVETDENQKLTVVFGNGQKGAIPPSGRKHIRATYRQGLGAVGNVDRGAVARIKKAHPLIDRAAGSAMLGGADPAAFTDVQRQATRYIRTFDRAVSVQDHADTALLYPGVARASASVAEDGAIEVVVATATGEAPVLTDVEAFLNARRDTSLPMRVVEPDPTDVYLSVLVEHDPAYLTENVRLAVQDALIGTSGLFVFATRDFGQAAHLSDVYERVAAAEGVTFVDVTRFRLQNATGVKDLLRAESRQWLRLLPSNLDVAASPGVAE